MSNVPPPPPPPVGGPGGPPPSDGPSSMPPPPANAGFAPPPSSGGYQAAGGNLPSAAPTDGGPLSPTWMITTGPPAGWAPKQKMVAGILGILLNGLGAHSFYLGNTKKGVIQLVVSIVTCGLGGIWGLIEGIQILTGSIKTDAYGVPLTE